MTHSDKGSVREAPEDLGLGGVVRGHGCVEGDEPAERIIAGLGVWEDDGRRQLHTPQLISGQALVRVC